MNSHDSAIYDQPLPIFSTERAAAGPQREGADWEQFDSSAAPRNERTNGYGHSSEEAVSERTATPVFAVRRTKAHRTKSAERVHRVWIQCRHRLRRLRRWCSAKSIPAPLSESPPLPIFTEARRARQLPSSVGRSRRSRMRRALSRFFRQRKGRARNLACESPPPSEEKTLKSDAFFIPENRGSRKGNCYYVPLFCHFSISQYSLLLYTTITTTATTTTTSQYLTS